MRFLLILALLVSCSHVDRQIDRETHALNRVESREKMIDHMRDVIDENPNLTQQQKDDFFELHVQVMGEVQEIGHVVRKLKVVLFNELSSESPSSAKMDRIVSKIKKLHVKKLDIMVKAFYKAKEILGVHFKEINYERFHHPYSIRS